MQSRGLHSYVVMPNSNLYCNILQKEVKIFISQKRTVCISE